MNILSIEKARELSPLTLAFYGDSVYETLVRRKLVENGSVPSSKLHKRAISFVCAAFQSAAVDMIEPLLCEDEYEIYRRGRNANGATVPKSSNPHDYRRATGLEALFGYLYLTGGFERAEQLFEVIYNEKKAQTEGAKA